MIRFDARLDRGGFVFDVAFASDAPVTALFGASGSGKSTAIAIAAGLEQPDRARIEIGGSVLSDTEVGTMLPPWRRRIGLVFQDALLFPHLNVRHNLLYGRAMRRGARRIVRMEDAIAALGIGHLLDRKPASLSGGERQRVAIGRALLSNPDILMMDEPLSSLDTDRKREILPLVARIAADFAVPILYVSHSAEEVAQIAGQVVLLAKGKVVAQGTPAAILGLSRDGDRFEILSVLSGTVVGYDGGYDLSEVAHPSGRIHLVGRIGDPGRQVRIVIRATDVTLAAGLPGSTTAQTALTGTVAAITQLDQALALVDVQVASGEILKAAVTRQSVDRLRLIPGVPVHAMVKTVALDERGLV